MALASKKHRRKLECEIDFLGFEVENKFIVGYGSDFCEKYRNLPYIAVFKEDCN